MHKQYLTNEEDIGFPKVLSAKQLPGIGLELNTREIGNTTTTSPGLELGHGLFHYVLQSVCYNSADMNKLTRNIPEVIAFSKWPC
jgi:hypothetical protein